MTERIRHAAGELRVWGGAVVTWSRGQTRVRSLVRVPVLAMAVVMMMTVILAPEAAGVGRGVVERPGASQPRRQVEVAEVE